ncbi:4-hydroxy-3-methylbut-2-enyl diphosphate reductase, partial [Pseudonocardia benzenivorans]
MTAPLPHTLGPPVVCAPLAVERRALDGDALAGVRLVRTGMGRRAAGTARALAVDGPRPVLVAGVAGALAPHLEPRDVVVADEVRDGP